jgi:hypothetical protein
MFPMSKPRRHFAGTEGRVLRDEPIAGFEYSFRDVPAQTARVPSRSGRETGKTG